MNNSIKLTPEDERLLDLRKVLRNKLSTLIEEKYSMIEKEKSILTALYISKVGQLRYDLFVVETDIAKLKLEMHLLQVYVNQNKKIDFEAVNKEIEAATEHYKQELEHKAQQIMAAQHILSLPLLSDFEAAELKRLYHIIVKRLHPDLNPDTSDDEKELFAQAQSAYKNGDIDLMRNLYEKMEKKEPVLPKLETLADEVESLKKKIAKIQNDIEKLNNTFPFNQRDFLDNEALVEKEQQRIREEIETKCKQRDEYQQYVNVLRLWKPGLLN